MTTPTTITFATTVSLSLSFRIEESEWLGRYDRLEVWRSRLTDGGPYEEVTGPVWAPAIHLAGGADSAPQLAPLVGKTLTLQWNEQPVLSVTFTGTDPLTPAQIASQIGAVGVGQIEATAALDGTISIETLQPGSIAVLRVGGDAASVLGLSTVEPTCLAFGQDPRVPLVVGQAMYTFVDPHGSTAYFYRTRLRNSLTGETSEFSLPIPGTVTTVLPTTDLILGEVRLADPSGRAVANRRVLVDVPTQYLTVSGTTIFGYSFEFLTDQTGYGSVALVRGLRAKISVGGTGMVRDITVPTDPTLTAFNLFDSSVGSSDVWTVQKPNIDYLVRRS